MANGSQTQDNYGFQSPGVLTIRILQWVSFARCTNNQDDYRKCYLAVERHYVRKSTYGSGMVHYNKTHNMTVPSRARKVGGPGNEEADHSR